LPLKTKKACKDLFFAGLEYFRLMLLLQHQILFTVPDTDAASANFKAAISVGFQGSCFGGVKQHQLYVFIDVGAKTKAFTLRAVVHAVKVQHIVFQRKVQACIHDVFVTFHTPKTAELAAVILQTISLTPLEKVIV
jgi:hypothetical protein